jgi:hypothetical protein
MKTLRVALLLLTSASALRAQSAAVDTSPRDAWKRDVAHYGKWVAAASAVGFTALAIEQHRHSNDAWNSLIAICNQNSQNCSVGPDGRYRFYQSEYYYQLAIYYDHRARWRLIAGQVSLLASIGLFVADLRGRSPTPANIPVHPLAVSLTPTSDGAALTFHIDF